MDGAYDALYRMLTPYRGPHLHRLLQERQSGATINPKATEKTSMPSSRGYGNAGFREVFPTATDLDLRGVSGSQRLEDRRRERSHKTGLPTRDSSLEDSIIADSYQAVAPGEEISSSCETWHGSLDHRDRAGNSLRYLVLSARRHSR